MLTVYLAARLAAELGGGRFAQWLCGIATMLMPAYLLLGNTLTTSSFEPLFWTLALFIAVCIVRSRPADAPLLWAALGIAAALGAYAKYSIVLPVVGIAGGLLATSQRRALRSPYPVYACGLALLVLSPNIAWQAAHGWPFLAVLRGDAAHRPALAAGYALEYRAWLAQSRSVHRGAAALHQPRSRADLDRGLDRAVSDGGAA